MPQNAPRLLQRENDACTAPVELGERLEILAAARGLGFVVDFLKHDVVDGANLNYLHEPPCPCACGLCDPPLHKTRLVQFRYKRIRILGKVSLEKSRSL
jgi:hypothetical protein